MKGKTFNKTTLATAVAAVLAAPGVMASNEEGNGKSSVEIDKRVDTEKEIEYEGHVNIDGEINTSSLGMAVIENKQLNAGNAVTNDNNSNNASMGDNALRNSSGNIGANTAAGDNNTQSNSAALAAADAGFVFGHGDSEVFSEQAAVGNQTGNVGARNSASLGGNALQNASGNIGANVAAGSSNAQQNNLAATSGAGSMGEANTSTHQVAAGNTTENAPGEVVTESTSTESISLSMSGVEGDYTGISDQQGDVYLDTWIDGQLHPEGSDPGHIDVDDEAQNAVDKNDDGGALSFNETGDLELSGTATGSASWTTVERRRTTNTASIDGNALRNAGGNIGVNSAAGTNNLQSNSLAVTTVGPEGAE